jgi:two-component system cell cycle sensor histidine kinase PleC
MAISPETARLLIAGTEAPKIRALCDLLVKHGFQNVRGVTEAELAQDAVPGYCPDLILVRIEPGDAAGERLFKNIEGLEKERYVPVLVLDSESKPGEIVERVRTLTAMRLLYKDLNEENVRLRAGAQQCSISYDEAVTVLKKTEDQLEAELAEYKDRCRSKSEFIANLSHELRTPLNSIIGFSEILKNETFGPHGSPKYKEYAGDIHGAAAHLLTLINDILEFSRAESGQLDLEFEPVDVQSTIHSSARMLHEKARAKGVTLRVDIAPDFPRLRTDERRLRQVLLNVVGNAIKFTPSVGSVTVKAGIDPVDGAFIVVVSDTGIGIDTADLPRVMTRYGQVKSAQSDHDPGTGLGLPLTRKIVEALGGTLEVRSRRGVGTAVTLRFPPSLVIADEGTAAKAAGTTRKIAS